MIPFVNNDPDSTNIALDRFDRVIEWLLISLLAFMPFAFGAVEGWSQEVVIALAAVIWLCFLLKQVFRKDTKPVWSWAYICVAVFTLIAVFQLIGLPTAVVQVISPNTAAIKKELLSDLPNANQTLSSMTLSFYPHATKHELRLILAIAAVFVVVVGVYRQPQQIKRLLAAIAVIGGTAAILALAQDLFGNGKIYWFVATGSDRAYSGPFIRNDHFGQFMNLSIGAALGLMMVRLHEAFAGKEVTPPFAAEYLSSPQAKAIWLLVAMVILGAVSVFVSLTRGGVISMLIAGAFTTLVLSSRKSLRGRGWIMVLTASGAMICVLYIGFDAVYARLATLRDLHEYHGRWQMVRDIGVACTKFPLLGSGLGTHQVVYPMFDRSTISAVASHAENEYAQAAEETGLIGLLTLVVFGIIVWRSYVRNVRTGFVPIGSAAYGLGFGLLAVMIHSLSDFGQHIPANAFLSSVFCALLVVLARTGQNPNYAVQILLRPWKSRSFTVIVLICTAGIWGCVLAGANNARIAEAHWKKALVAEHELTAKAWQGSDSEYANLLRYATATASYEPDNVKYRHWLNVYRWHFLSRTTDADAGTTTIPHQTIPLVRHIVSELNVARLLCPTYAPCYCVAGQLEKFVLDEPEGAERIELGYKLAPSDPTACFVAGLTDTLESRVDQSLEKLQRAIQLDGRLFDDVVSLYVNRVHRPDLALTVAAEDARGLTRVTDAIDAMQEYEQLADTIRARVIELLNTKCSQPDTPAGALVSLANICVTEKDYEAAIENYRRALSLDYGQVQWRLTLATLLAKTDRIAEAIDEAAICLRLRPQFGGAQKLIADLSAQPTAQEQVTKSH